MNFRLNVFPSPRNLFYKLLRNLIPFQSMLSSSSSQAWLDRQHRDVYVRNARIHSYRCRSAFKLLQLNSMVSGGLLHPGDIVVDCGAAPGSWTQVATKIVCPAVNKSAKGLVVSFDLQDFRSVEGAICLSGIDIRDTIGTVNIIRENILNHLAGKDCQGELSAFSGVDIILSDIAPPASGHNQIDAPSLIYLAQCVLTMALRISKPGGSLVVKLWNCPEVKNFTDLLESLYIGPWDISDFAHSKRSKHDRFIKKPAVRLMKPQASRDNSAEIYVVAKGFSLPHL